MDLRSSSVSIEWRKEIEMELCNLFRPISDSTLKGYFGLRAVVDHLISKVDNKRFIAFGCFSSLRVSLQKYMQKIEASRTSAAKLSEHTQ